MAGLEWRWRCRHPGRTASRVLREEYLAALLFIILLSLAYWQQDWSRERLKFSSPGEVARQPTHKFRSRRYQLWLAALQHYVWAAFYYE